MVPSITSLSSRENYEKSLIQPKMSRQKNRREMLSTLVGLISQLTVWPYHSTHLLQTVLSLNTLGHLETVPPAPDFKLNTPTLKKDERLYFSLLTMQPDGSTLLLEASPQVTPDLIPIRNQNRNQTLTRFLKVAILKVGLILQFQIHQSLSMLVHHLDQSVDLNGTLATEPLVPALPPNMSILNQALRLSISTAMTHQETSKLLLAQSQWWPS